MSHFTVMVISDKPLDEVSLDPILMPWHEYECTGLDNEYVVDVDMTDEVTEEFNKPCDVVVLADGKIIGRYDDSLYTDSTDEHGYKCKNRALPEGAVEKEISAEEARKHGIGYKTMAECAEDYYGGFERDGRFYRHTNPNAKWDWWVVGGRWSGMLKPKYDPRIDPKNIGSDGKVKWPTEWANIGNIAQLKDIAIDELRAEAEKDVREQHAKATEIIAGRPFKTWEEVRTEFGDEKIDDARKAFHDQPVIQDLRAAELLPFFDVDEALKNFRGSVETLVANARGRVLQTYAIVKDGKWYEKGEMGWFGMSSNEKDPEAWDREFAALLDGLPPETWIAIVDCHI